MSKAVSGKRERRSFNDVAFWSAVGILAFVMLAPLAVVVKESLQAPISGTRSSYFTIAAWLTTLRDSGVRDAIKNTLLLTFASQTVSLPIGIFFSWLIGRTDLPGRRWFELTFWISFFLPALAVVQGWILLLDPHYGLINVAAKAVLGSRAWTFDIYSWQGIVAAHLLTSTISAKVMMMTPAFQNMDSRLEDAARLAGDSRMATLWKITAPLVAPTIIATAILGIIRSLESFEIELILGAPHNIQVYSTRIYQLVRQDPVDYATASVLGVIVIVGMSLLAAASHTAVEGRRHVTISGHAQGNLLPLGAWRWPAFAAVAATAVLLTVVPIGFLLTGSFMTLFGFFNVAHVWTFAHWGAVLSDPIALSSIRNTLVMATASAVLTVVLSVVIAYGIVRGPTRRRAVLDLLSWIPFTLPGVLFSLAVMWLFLNVPGIRALYGSMASLVITITLASITIGVQLVKGNLIQISRELEEASWLAGCSRWSSIVKIVVPLSARALAVVAVITFISATRDVSHLALLATSDNRPMAIMQLDYMADGRFEESAVVGFIIAVLAVGAAFVARYAGVRISNAAYR